jgi:hypothetical protein
VSGDEERRAAGKERTAEVGQRRPEMKVRGQRSSFVIESTATPVDRSSAASLSSSSAADSRRSPAPSADAHEKIRR